ncbi:MAG TPA: hypothetical protein VGD81_17310 [Opitutaceae bacterium]
MFALFSLSVQRPLLPLSQRLLALLAAVGLTVVALSSLIVCSLVLFPR